MKKGKTKFGRCAITDEQIGLGGAIVFSPPDQLGLQYSLCLSKRKYKKFLKWIDKEKHKHNKKQTEEYKFNF